MKAMRFFLILVIGLSVAVSAQAQKKGEKTVVYDATMHCESCKAKVEKNIAFEKGVKDLKVNLDAQTITVTFREDKNSAEGIKKAIEKLEIRKVLVDSAGSKGIPARRLLISATMGRRRSPRLIAKSVGCSLPLTTTNSGSLK